jgi:hypothetical protein
LTASAFFSVSLSLLPFIRQFQKEHSISCIPHHGMEFSLKLQQQDKCATEKAKKAQVTEYM